MCMAQRELHEHTMKVKSQQMSTNDITSDITEDECSYIQETQLCELAKRVWNWAS